MNRKIYIKNSLISIGVGVLITIILAPLGCSGEYIKICYWTLPYKLAAWPIIWLLEKIIFFKPVSFFDKDYIIIPASIISYSLIGILITYLRNRSKKL